MTAGCRHTRGLLDSHLCDELRLEESAAVRDHVAGCALCAAELERRRRLRRELTAALDVAGDVGGLEARILAAIAADRPRSRRAVLIGSAAAAAGVLAALGSLWPRMATAPPPSAPPPPRGVRFDATIYEDTRDVHLLCALRGRYPSPLPPERAPERLERYAALWAATASGLIGETLLEAHVCPRGGRRYGHVILRHGTHLVSVVATADRFGALPEEGVLLSAPGGAVAVRGVVRDAFRLAASADAVTAAFVVSDLDPAENGAMGVRILPQVLPALAAGLPRSSR